MRIGCYREFLFSCSVTALAAASVPSVGRDFKINLFLIVYFELFLWCSVDEKLSLNFCNVYHSPLPLL